jgi:exosome complex exonuclease DIS3/RRP44
MSITAVNRNDDPETSDEEGGEKEVEDAESGLSRREQEEAKEKARRAKLERQPTGRVVGVIRRAWRPYVFLLLLLYRL